MVGLDAAGKTTILYQLNKGETVKTTPQTCFNGDTLDYKGLNFIVWDVGRQDEHSFWKLYHQYRQNTDGLIFVVDSNDRDRIEDAAEQLKKILTEEELKDCCLLVMANKQDLNGALAPDEVIKRLGIGDIKGRTWLVQGTSGITGQGIKEGLDWMTSILLKKNE